MLLVIAWRSFFGLQLGGGRVYFGVTLGNMHRHSTDDFMQLLFISIAESTVQKTCPTLRHPPNRSCSVEV